ncbi:MAG: filamentous hemagglutinin N-terminal domain-containing protein [Burkholderiaceae bacterium]|jgi:filamentous hemagglutinin family protein
MTYPRAIQRDPPIGPTGALRTLLVFLACLLPGMAVQGQIRTDGSLGHAPQTLTGPNYVIPQSLGLVSGQNLFQSFSTFNLAVGEAASFTTSTAGIANIISRVTGGSASLLYGNINVLPASGAPNFFLINPAGVTFGAGASINVPAAFHVTTANYLKFSDGNFYSDLAHVSTFSALAPEAFGFLGTTRATIAVGDGSFIAQLAAPVSVIGGDVTVNNADVATYGSADVRVAAVGADQVEIPLTGPLPVLHGNLAITNGGEIYSYTFNQNSGNVYVSAGNITIDTQGSSTFTGIFTDAPSGTGNAGRVQVSAAQNLSVVNGGAISSTTESSGNSAGVFITAGSINIDSESSPYITGFYTDAAQGSTGNAGPVQVTATNGLSLAHAAIISSTTESSGSAAGVLLNVTGPLSIATGSSVYSATSGSGASGPIQVDVAGPLSFASSGQIYTAAYASGNAGPIQVQAQDILANGAGSTTAAGILSIANQGSGNAGDISVATTGGLSLINGGTISSESNSAGNSGNISITAHGNLLVSLSSISADTFSTGAAGNVSVSAANIDLAGSATSSTGITSNSHTATSGPAGTISVVTPGSLSITSGANITSTTSSSFDAGAIKVSAGSIVINSAGVSDRSTGISTNTEKALGGAGSIDVSAVGNLTLLQYGEIESDSELSFGNSGTVRVNAGSLTINAQGEFAGISSSMVSLNPLGKGGSVQVAVSGDLTLKDGGTISSDTFLFGSAGSVQVRAGNILIDGANLIQDTGITSDSNSVQTGANAGTVEVSAQGAISLVRAGAIESSTFSEGHAGSVEVSANTISVDGFASRIDAEALSGSGVPGSVTVDASGSITVSDLAEISIANRSSLANPSGLTPTLLTLSAPNITVTDRGLISAIALGNAPAGDIRIQFGNELLLDPSAISTSSVSGNGGSITILGGQILELNQSAITTSASGSKGNGGNIIIDVDALILNSGFIQANTTAAKAQGGNVLIDVEALIPSGDSLFVGGSTPYVFEPDVFGFNVIQAAAPTGLSGTIRITNPALDLSASLSALGERFLTNGALGRDRCQHTAGSSLASGGRGGFAPSARNLVRADPETTPDGHALQDTRLELAALEMECPH